MDLNIFEEELFQKIKILNETIWEGRIKRNNIEQWLGNFENKKEKINALFLLSQFMYFGNPQIKEMLKILYRDFFKYPLVEKIRKLNNNTVDLELINSKFNEELNCTRFVAIGGSSESSNHLLYYFRQENHLAENLFISVSDIFQSNIREKKADEIISTNKLFDEKIKNYVFIDDFCGSGSQAKRYSENIVKAIKGLKSEVKVSYLMLFSTEKGKEQTRKLFDSSETVFVLDESFKCFSDSSRYFIDDYNEFINKELIQEISSVHGLEMLKIIAKKEKTKYPKLNIDTYAEKHKFGYDNCQLLLGFGHNVPNNTLPIFWFNEEGKNWYPIFKRINKI